MLKKLKMGNNFTMISTCATEICNNLNYFDNCRLEFKLDNS